MASIRKEKKKFKKFGAFLFNHDFVRYLRLVSILDTNIGKYKFRHINWAKSYYETKVSKGEYFNGE